MGWKKSPGECPSCHHQGNLSDFVFDKEMLADDLETHLEKIMTVIDKSLLLGAALDCMSEDGKLKFKHKLTKVLKNV